VKVKISELSLDSPSPRIAPKLHLLVSVFLTDKSLPNALSYGKKESLTQDKVNQFLCMIDSIKEIHFSSQNFYLAFDGSYSQVAHLVGERILTIFPSASVVNGRLDTFPAWKSAAMQTPEETDFILLKTNHDHAFVDESVDEFNSFLLDLHSLGPRSIGGITHWPEMVGENNLDIVRSRSGNSFNFLKETTWTLGTCVVSKQLFEEWWREDFTFGKRIIRPDNPFGPSIYFLPAPLMIPSREFFRHLDGYGHAKVRSPYARPVRPCCVIEDGQVVHRNWKRGNYFVGKHQPDLPLLPLIDQANSICKYLNLVSLASAHTLNFKNIWRLLNPKNGGLAFIKFPFLFLLITDVHLVIKMPRAVTRFLGINKTLRRFIHGKTST